MPDNIQDNPDKEATIMPAATPISIEPLADKNTIYDQHQPVLSDESASRNSTTRCLRWQPCYLRRFVLLGFISVFISVFILIIVIIEALLAVSDRNQGLTTSTSSQHYLWKYGPTAFLTGVAAFWARTEYQSKIVAPWIRLS